MVNCRSLLKSVLVAAILVAVAESGPVGSSVQKLATCCEKVSNVEITEPLLGFRTQRHNPPCVRAVILETKSGEHCIQLNAPWVRQKVQEFMSRNVRSTVSSVVRSSPVSLLSIITSSPPSSSTPRSSSTTPPSRSSE